MKFIASIAVTLACWANLAHAVRHQDIPGFRNARFRVPPAGQPPQSPTASKNSTFMQLIDHDNPALGKFSQFYYWDDYFYKGPGSPVVIFTPGEINVTNYYTYLTKNRTSGVIAEAIGAAVVVIEHRYWGNSSPYKDLSTENLQYLTLKNAIADLNYFALHAKLPFDKTGASNADKAPWILVGGSYSGALTAWTQAKSSPQTMWAYYASSAVVEAIGNFWEYFVPQTMYMPKNCSTDVSRVIEHLDNVYETGSLKQQEAVREKFGFENLPYYDDFVSALTLGPSLWQGNQFYENAGFFDFCDAIEGVKADSTNLPGASGVGLSKALEGYASWTKNVLIPGYCESFGYFKGKNNVECFNTHDKNSPLFTDWTVSNTFDRQWEWMLCNEPFGYWQNGAPPKQETLVSRLLNNKYWTRQCELQFPTQNGATYGLRKGVKYEDVNLYTGGWLNTNSTRLITVNGQYDPWRQSTISSTTRPGGPAVWTPDQPVYVVPGGYHTSDLVTENGKVNQGCATVQANVVRQIKQWVKEFPGAS